MNEEEKRIEELRLRKNAFTRHNFMELEYVVPDEAAYCLEIRPESANPYGMVHGGALYTLADDAAGGAAHSDGRYYVTQTGTLHFLRNAPSGTLRAVAKVRHRGKSTCLIEVEITDGDGTLMATGEFTFFCVDKARMDRRAEQA